MLRMICGKTLRDRTSNETIGEMTGVKKIEELLKELRLRWYGCKKGWIMKKLQ